MAIVQIHTVPTDLDWLNNFPFLSVNFFFRPTDVAAYKTMINVYIVASANG